MLPKPHTLTLSLYVYRTQFQRKSSKDPSRPGLLCPHYSPVLPLLCLESPPKQPNPPRFVSLCTVLFVYLHNETVTQFVFVIRNYTKQYIRMVYCSSLDTYFNIYFITCPRIGGFFYLFVGTHAVFIGCYIHSVEYRAENIFAVHTGNI